MKLLVSLLFTLPTVLLNCLTKDACTDEYRMVILSISNNSGPVVLDSAYTIRNSNNHRFNSQNLLMSPGRYTVLDDTYQQFIEDKREMFTFKGFKGGVQVVNEQYDISADDCHITKHSGKDSVLVP